MKQRLYDSEAERLRSGCKAGSSTACDRKMQMLLPGSVRMVMQAIQKACDTRIAGADGIDHAYLRRRHLALIFGRHAACTSTAAWPKMIALRLKSRRRSKLSDKSLLRNGRVSHRQRL